MAKMQYFMLAYYISGTTVGYVGCMHSLMHIQRNVFGFPMNSSWKG